jgi:hypothetical protein
MYNTTRGTMVLIGHWVSTWSEREATLVRGRQLSNVVNLMSGIDFVARQQETSLLPLCPNAIAVGLQKGFSQCRLALGRHESLMDLLTRPSMTSLIS